VAAASLVLGRKFIGIDIERKHVETTRRRIEEWQRVGDDTRFRFRGKVNESASRGLPMAQVWPSGRTRILPAVGPLRRHGWRANHGR
jgi:hypothetical protein